MSKYTDKEMYDWLESNEHSISGNSYDGFEIWMKSFGTIWVKDVTRTLLLERAKPGVIYKIYEMIMPPFVENENNKDMLLEYLGWQPLPRPEQQRASVLKVAKDTNLDTISGVQKYYFKHSISQSKKIWKQFDEGKALFPDDSAADLANICSKLNSFTNKQLNKAFERFELWSGKKINEEQILNSLKIETVEQTKLNWNGLVETDFKYCKKIDNQGYDVCEQYGQTRCCEFCNKGYKTVKSASSQSMSEWLKAGTVNNARFI